MKSPVISEIGARVATRLGESARKFEGKTVLITGANGFLGQYFLEAFRNRPARRYNPQPT